MRDLVSPEVQHTKSLGRFSAFYNELGKLKVQRDQKYVAYRSDWIIPNGKIIELGCHVGFNLIYYARKGFYITGVDLSATLLEEARRRISLQPREVREKIEIIKSFIEALPEDKKYNTVLLTETLEHVINPLTTLKKATALLADDGQIFVTSPATKVGNNSHVRGISRDFMKKLANDCGLKITHWEDIANITACVLEKI